MKFTLKSYQTGAVADVLSGLTTAVKLSREMAMTSSMALTAPTGAGKTVMAAAVIESMFFGSSDFGMLADPGAVVLWFTSDPSLNEQTRHRLGQASERLRGCMQVIGSMFQDPLLTPGTVYFLNSQKLGAKSKLVRASGQQSAEEVLAAPDLRSRTFWETLANTIHSPDLNLYVFLDEAHIGMRRQTATGRAEKQTIVRKLVDGEGGAPPVPVVLGISATVERFKSAMEQTTDRATLPDVVVDPVAVQESGLLKDTILLSFPAESGSFDTVLLRHAVSRIKESSRLWAEYQASERADGDDAVAPLLVLQLPNKPTERQQLDVVQTVLDEWREIGDANIAHVFGEHTDLTVGQHTIAYVKPEDVQERPTVRVLLAKDAISTGWDCPRAEVLISFRPAKDATHIAQLLGRMVRTPLARRIEGDDRLNAVECILPMFRRETAEQVAKNILGDTVTDADARPQVVVEKVEVRPNQAVPDEVWEVFDRLPSQTVPRRGGKQANRFTALGAELARDGIRPKAHEHALGELVGVLNGLAARYGDRVDEQIKDLTEMSGETLAVGPGSGLIGEGTRFSLQADDRAIEAEYRVAKRLLTPQLAKAYAEVQEDQYQDGFFTAHLRTAALARIPEVVETVDGEATKFFRSWIQQYRRDIKRLTEARRATYDDLRALGNEPEPIDIVRPDVWLVPRGTTGETEAKHLLADEDGRFPVGELNDWERLVLGDEIEGCVAWYRNPSRASTDALAIPYQDARGLWRRLCPDFVFFEQVRGRVKPSIIDPHRHSYGDAIPKLRGLARFADQHGEQFHRIEALSTVESQMRVLDVTDLKVREAIEQATDAEQLYASDVATDY